MSRKLLLAAYCIVCFAAFRSPAAEYVISAGDITSLTNLIGKMGNNIRLEPGIYDLRPLTNAPMYTSEYYGKSLLDLGKWTKLSGISPNAADTVLIGDVIERLFKQGNNPNLGAALSLVLMILVFVCTGIMNRFGADEEGGVIA